MSDQPTEPQMPAESPPEPVAPSRSHPRPRVRPWEGLAVAACAAAMALIALIGAGGGALIAVAVAGCAALAVVAVVGRNGSAAVAAAVMAATAVSVAVGLSLGDRARASGGRGFPFPAVVGLPLQRARALFDRHGPVHYEIRRVSYGAQNTVLRATGYSTDGTFGPGSTITLVVGTRPPRP